MNLLPDNTATASTANVQYTIGLTQIAEHPSLDNCREGFIAGMAEAGFVEGKNITYDYQNAQGDTATANTIAQKFVADGDNLILAIATPSAMAAYNAAQPMGIPVVFCAVSDPVAAELVQSFDTPGETITGTSDILPVEKQLTLVRDILPKAKNIGILYNTSEVNSLSQIEQLKAAAPDAGFTIVEQGIATASDMALAVDTLLPKVDCVLNLTDNLVVANLPILIEKAKEANIPVFGSEEEQVKNGCIASVGLDYYQLGMQTGRMAAKILNGESPANIPVETITEATVTLNSVVFDQLGLTVPEDLKGTATFVDSNS